MVRLMCYSARMDKPKPKKRGRPVSATKKEPKDLQRISVFVSPEAVRALKAKAAAEGCNMRDVIEAYARTIHTIKLS